MSTLFNAFLFLHVAGGAIGLFAGTINLVRKKGGKSHQLVGKVFTYSMLTAGIFSLALTVLHPSYFLFIVGAFTIYLVATGNRYMYLKLLGREQRPSVIDWFITGSMLVASIAFLAYGVMILTDENTFGTVLVVFGVLGLRFIKKDIDNYRGRVKEKNYWLLEHIKRMTGSYIAGATAFLVVNAKYSPVTIPSFVVWLLPTAILTPLIIRWVKKYKVEL